MEESDAAASAKNFDDEDDMEGSESEPETRASMGSEPPMSSDEDDNIYSTTCYGVDPDAVRNAIAKMIIIDGLPFSFIEEPGFRGFCEVAFPPTFSLPSREAIIRECMQVYEENREKLKMYFKEKKPRVSLSVDTWSSLQGISHMRVTAHYIDENWELQKKILGFCLVDCHKGEEMAEMLERCLRGWGIDKVYALIVDNDIVNDNAGNALSEALTRCEYSVLGGAELHIRCESHIINFMVSECLEEMDKSVTSVRGAVKYIMGDPLRFKRFKECVEAEKIEGKKLLCLDVPTQWNSVYLMLDTAQKFERAFERYARQDDDFRMELTSGEDPTGVPNQAAWVNVRRLVKVLSPFYHLISKASGSLYTTTNLYLETISGVDELLQKWERDVDKELNSFAMRMRGKFKKYWGDPNKMNKNIFIAVMLDPSGKFEYVQFILKEMYGELKGKEVGEIIKRECYKLFEEYKGLVSRWMSSHQEKSDSCGANADGGVFSLCMSSHREKLQRWHEYLRHEAEIGEYSVKSELDKYLSESIVKRDVDFFDTISWWKLNSGRFPILAAMARDVLAVPISTVVLESAFCTGGRVLDAFKSSLTPTMAQALICAQSWLHSGRVPISTEEDMDTLDEDETDFEMLPMDTMMGMVVGSLLSGCN